MRANPAVTAALLLLVGLTACAGPTASGTGARAGATGPSGPRKPIVVPSPHADTPSVRPTFPTPDHPAPTGPPPAPDSFKTTVRLDAGKAREAVEGREYTVAYTSRDKAADGTDVSGLALTGDGRLVVTANPTPGGDPETPVQVGQGRVGLEDADGHRLLPTTEDSACRTPHRAPVSAREHEGSMVWVETARPSWKEGGPVDWCVFLRDPAGAVRLLDDSGDRVGSHQDRGLRVTLGGGRAYWTTPRTVSPDGGPETGPLRIMARPLDGSGENETVAERAGMPEATDDGRLFFVRTSHYDPSVPENRYEIHERGTDGQVRLVVSGGLAVGQGFHSLSVSGPRVAWLVTGPSTRFGAQPAAVYVLDTRTDEAVTVALPADHANNRPIDLRLTEDRLVWGHRDSGSTPAAYVYEFGGGSLWKLNTRDATPATDRYPAVFAAGPYLAWALGRGGGMEGRAAYRVVRWN
ncbi:hypothetical protein ACIQUQ_24740 [Streptomyces sp. NPDC101118]|uniref:hypothetical protein n=1 Tax=Streptomyces sp. NPDC101118 TaxID=3366109 RepID=UPI003825308D